MKKFTQADYLATEQRLAKSLGWTDVRSQVGSLTGKGSTDIETILPAWCRNWNDCGPLLGSYDVEIRSIFGRQEAVISVKKAHVLVHFSEHADRDCAIRYGIIEAVLIGIELRHRGVKSAAKEVVPFEEFDGRSAPGRVVAESHMDIFNQVAQQHVS